VTSAIRDQREKTLSESISLSLLHDTSIWPYFSIMVLFLCEAWLIQATVPFFREVVQRERADIGRFIELDGLRGLLATGVFFTHAESFRLQELTGTWGLPPSAFYSQMGVAPVAMFFLITGFLFWSKAQNETGVDLAIFFKNRVRRLAPAYLLAVFLVGVIVARVSHFQLQVSTISLVESILGYLTFNLIPGPTLNGYKNASVIYANVFWSLRVEWMFYLLYPLLAVFARSVRRQLVLAALAGTLYVALPIVRPHLAVRDGFGTFGLGTLEYFNFYLISYFSFGMLVASLKKRFAPAWTRGVPASVSGIGVVIFLLCFLAPKASPVEGGLLAYPLLLIVFGNSFFGLLRFRPLVLLGQLSYSMYLLHAIVLYSADRIMARFVDVAHMSSMAFWLITAGTGIVVVLLSAFSYRYFEAPFMKAHAARSRGGILAAAHAS
jgi:peptidoglycan/LPS O-acetylase OafA/YrhL